MSKKEICSICQNEIDISKSVLTSCNHRFCTTCFFKWLEKKADCPNCRKVFKERTNYDIEIEAEMLAELEDRVRDHSSILENMRGAILALEFKKAQLKINIDNLEKKREDIKKYINQTVRNMPATNRRITANQRPYARNTNQFGFSFRYGK